MDREKEYGQKDHVRLYGRDFLDRFKNYGFNIKSYSPRNHFNSTMINKYGFIPDDIIMVLQKA